MEVSVLDKSSGENYYFNADTFRLTIEAGPVNMHLMAPFWVIFICIFDMDINSGVPIIFYMEKAALIFMAMAGSLGASAQHSIAKKDITQTPPAVVFTKLLNNKNVINQQIQLVLVKFAPGEVSGAHRHPIPAIAYVLEGEIESTFNGKVKKFKKGEAFFEDPNLLHAATKNLSSTKPASLLVYFIGDQKKPFIIPEH